jgi:hypothetical protein
MEKTKIVQRYIELVYNEKSQLNEIGDLAERKLEACRIAKLDENSKEAIAIMDMVNKDVNEQIIQYIIANNSHEFALLIADQHLFADQIKQILDPMTDIVLRNKLSEQSSALLIRIKARLQSIFQGNKEINIASHKVRTMRLEDRLKIQKAG